MKIASFNKFSVGIVEQNKLFDVTNVLPVALGEMPEQRINWLIANWDRMKPVLIDARRTAAIVPIAGVCLLPANPAPVHVFAAPANYQKHLGELGTQSTVTKKGRTAREQGFFLKAPGSLIGSGGTVFLPKGSARRFDHESELAVIIGKPGANIPRARALEHVFGYTCLIDATLRIESGEFEEERSMRKSFAGFTPLGPYLVTADEVTDPMSLCNQLWVNGELRQDANTSEMIVGVAEFIELVSSVLPLRAGDVLAMGTPEGVGPIRPGDEICIAIETVGNMKVFVRESAEVAPRAY
ncbi:fumarylacetoacetate hydrolase [Trinickia symbiotica]|uniref:Fumarylacetoacetate hydrolase n=1 Tax=Trinickia symbiotica TaxID=863227 RepID=A0A2T3XKW8_9BURK|nr:fumarylacetoacetate hydrolase family protein [Trinickia symbiotica]PTB17079.1 fumarylacetoacetate hydrolase [Trinickia symbiotica]